nr:FAD:protein FMN transferase [Aestuariibacter salexigens]
MSVVFFVLVGCVPQPAGELHLTGRTMGTTYNVKVNPAGTIDPQALQAEIDALLVHINDLMSTYQADSELSRFNQHQSSDPFPLSAQTLDVMREAIRLGELSEGALDVTIGPLVNLWGFGPQGRPKRVPTAVEIDNAMARTGLHALELGPESAVKHIPSLYVDLSTIAKGYAVDEIAELLESRGENNYLVEIGGEMRLSGIKTNGDDWRIAIEKPVTNERAIQRVVTVGNNAIATSGDYRNYYEEDGVRYSHLIDPQSGQPIQHNLVAVTVVHPSSMTADGLATAFIVMGKEKAMQIAQQNNLAILLITRENDDFKEYTSDAFTRTVNVLN